MNTKRFHLSLPCKNIKETKTFYKNELGMEIGRKAYSWVDINLFGNQVSFTQMENSKLSSENYKFDDILIPSFHFGVIVDSITWDTLHSRLENKDFFAMGAKEFLLDQPGCHRSFFVIDPNGYFIEFKNFKNSSGIFKSIDD